MNIGQPDPSRLFPSLNAGPSERKPALSEFKAKCLSARDSVMLEGAGVTAEPLSIPPPAASDAQASYRKVSNMVMKSHLIHAFSQVKSE